MSTFLALVGLTLLGYALYAAYWLAKRSVYRALWRAGDIEFGDLLEALRKAPAWLTRSTR